MRVEGIALDHLYVSVRDRLTEFEDPLAKAGLGRTRVPSR